MHLKTVRRLSFSPATVCLMSVCLMDDSSTVLGNIPCRVRDGVHALRGLVGSGKVRLAIKTDIWQNGSRRINF